MQCLFASYLEVFQPTKVLVSQMNEPSFGRCNPAENVVCMNETCNVLRVLQSSSAPQEISHFLREILSFLFMPIVEYLLYVLLQI